MDQIIIFCAKYLIVFVVLGLVVVWLKVDRQLKKQLLVATIIAGVTAFILSRIAGHLYYDPRPFVSEHVQPLIAHGPDNGFPSDHALFTGTLTVLAFFYRKKIAAVMLVLTILVGLARVLALVHSPLDIVTAWILGAIGSVVGFYLGRWLVQKFTGKETSDTVPSSEI